MRLLAIDPGLKGGLAVFDDAVLMRSERLPLEQVRLSLSGMPRQQVSVDWLSFLVREHGVDQVVTEYQTAMPGQSSVATATTFLNWGLVLGLRALCPVSVVHPRVWKRHFSLGNNKQAAIAKAIHLFPSLGTNVLSDGEAEAVLIGHYWLEKGSAIAAATARKAMVKPRRAPRRATSSRPSGRARA